LEHEDACDECSCKELRRERVHLMNNNNNNNNNIIIIIRRRRRRR
jgi:hypothetical protein